MCSVSETLKRARMVGVPIVAIATPDPAATVQTVCRLVSDQANVVDAQGFVIEWDVLRGLSGIGETARSEVMALAANGYDETIGNPVACLQKITKLPAGVVVCLHLANRWFADASLAPSFIQGIWNLRDAFKTNHRCLILLGSSISLPAELQGDVLTIDEPLPDEAALGTIVTKLHEAAEVQAKPEQVAKAVQAVRGLPAFAAEQVTALSLRKNGLDLSALWKRKVQQIEQTPGLKVYHGHDSFDQIGGVSVVKEFLRRLIAGKRRPNVVVFIDEIEKMLGGARGDTSGVSLDQLGTLLSYMQDHESAGLIFIGPPGAAKSAVAKATGAEAAVLTIQLDTGAAKGSLVGQSEGAIRQALKVITAVGGNQSLWIATCNSITDLPPELRRRFTLGTWFFDLPDAAERAAIWEIYTTSFAVGLDTRKKKTEPLPADEGWTGAEIKQCCDLAHRLGCTLAEAAAFVVPVSRSAADSIEKLRTQASGRFLSASTRGVYVKSHTHEPEPVVARRLQLVGE